MVLFGTSGVKEVIMAVASVAKRRTQSGEEVEKRDRILEAAFAAFRERGYATTSTFEIAQRARVSKRELYALVGNKQALLVAAINRRARRLDLPADLPELRDRETLGEVLASFGTR